MSVSYVFKYCFNFGHFNGFQVFTIINGMAMDIPFH